MIDAYAEEWFKDEHFFKLYGTGWIHREQWDQVQALKATYDNQCGSIKPNAIMAGGKVIKGLWKTSSVQMGPCPPDNKEHGWSCDGARTVPVGKDDVVFLTGPAPKGVTLGGAAGTYHIVAHGDDNLFAMPTDEFAKAIDAKEERKWEGPAECKEQLENYGCVDPV